MRLLVPFLILLFGLAASGGAQTSIATINLDDGDPQTADDPFGIVMDPDGIHAYVALCGDLAPFNEPPSNWHLYNNNKVVKISLASGSLVGQATVGYFPQEIALTLTPASQTRHLYVSNSTSGTVSCLTPSMSVVATIPLTPCPSGFNGLVFPFGIIASPDSSRVYVQGTSCGTLDVIDSDPSSATFNSVLFSINVPGMMGRPAWISYPLLAVPITHFDPGFTYSQTGFAVVDVTNPLNQTVHYSAAPVSFSFPTANDLAVLPNGRVLLCIGFANDPMLVEMDPLTGLVTNQIVLPNPPVNITLHGLGVSPDGRLAIVTDLNQGNVVFVDLATWTVAAIENTGLLTLPNEVVLTPDGSQALVTLQEAAAVRVFGDLPAYDLALTATPAPPLGSTAVISVDNIEHGQLAAVFASLGGGPQIIGNFTVHLSDPLALVALLPGNVLGELTLPVAIPNDPTFHAVTFHLQAGTTDRSGTFRLSNPVSSTIP